MNEILLRVRQIRKELTAKEGIVADALLNEPSAVITRTITSYAQYISSSTATITRFCMTFFLSDNLPSKRRTAQVRSRKRQRHFLLRAGAGADKIHPLTR